MPSSNAQRSIKKRKQKDFKSQKWWMTPRKACLPDTIGLMYKGIPREYDNMFKACIDVNQTNSNTKKEKQTQICTYNKEAIFH